jgi:O-antigen/teichoic acid export membrane protein
MAMLSIGVARMVEDFGMESILVQDRSIVGQAESRLAGFLFAIAAALCLVFTFIAYPIAGFFREPEVAIIIIVLSPLFLMDAAQVVPRARLQRNLQFHRLAVVTSMQAVTASILLVTAARSGMGHWALVVNNLGGAGVATVLLILWHPYTVEWPRQIAKISRPLLQGWRLLASRAAWYGYSNADQTIIGRVLGKDSLGAYSFAMTFSGMAQQEVGAIVSRVVPGIFSEVQQKPTELRRYFLLLTEFLTIVTFPISIGLAATADLLVPLVLGPNWHAVTAPLRLLCIYSAYLSSQTLTSHILLWTGRFRINMWCTIFAMGTMPLALLAAVRYGGLYGVAWAWALIFPIINIPSMVCAFRAIRISALEWLDALKPAIVSCAFMLAAVFTVRIMLPKTFPAPVVAAISVVIGAVIYPASAWFLFRSRVNALIDVARAIRSGKKA